MKKQNRDLIREMKRLLGNDKHLTVESIVFNETDEPGYDMPDRENFEREPDFNGKAFNQQENSSVVDIINKIRVLSLKGISQLAETPDSPQYDTLKKVWQLIDKTVETKKTPEKA